MPLSLCLPGWWATPPVPCAMSFKCMNPATPDLQRACAATDCTSRVFFGYGALLNGNGTYHQVSAVISEGERLLCDVVASSGSWSTVDTTTILLTFPSPTGTARAEMTCGGDRAVRDEFTELSRVTGPLTSVLSGRAEAGAWSSCPW